MLNSAGLLQSILYVQTRAAEYSGFKIIKPDKIFDLLQLVVDIPIIYIVEYISVIKVYLWISIKGYSLKW